MFDKNKIECPYCNEYIQIIGMLLHTIREISNGRNIKREYTRTEKQDNEPKETN